MIRRESHAPDAADEQWILISQVDHARLSGRLAEHWGAGGLTSLVEPDELLWAIAHHDDGWAEWDASPDVEPASGRPRSFTEMDQRESLEIWVHSITHAAEHGPLAGYAVAGHFCAILRRYGFGWKNDEQRAAEAQRFLATYDSLSEACLWAWQARMPAEHTPEVAQRALAQLQFFDALSLWFCCDEATAPDTFEPPGGPAITASPLGRSAADGSLRIALAPWPLTVDALNLQVPARAVAVRKYESRTELAATPAQSVVLRWQLEPAKS